MACSCNPCGQSLPQLYANTCSVAVQADRRRDWFRALSGPDRGQIVLGARSDIERSLDQPERWSFFTGSMADVNIYTRGIEADQAECLFREGEDLIGTWCAVPHLEPHSLSPPHILSLPLIAAPLFELAVCSSLKHCPSPARCRRPCTGCTCTPASWTACCRTGWS